MPHFSTHADSFQRKACDMPPCWSPDELLRELVEEHRDTSFEYCKVRKPQVWVRRGSWVGGELPIEDSKTKYRFKTLALWCQQVSTPFAPCCSLIGRPIRCSLLAAALDLDAGPAAVPKGHGGQDLANEPRIARVSQVHFEETGRQRAVASKAVVFFQVTFLFFQLFYRCTSAKNSQTGH